MKLARSSYYYKPKSQSPERMEAEADLRDRIEAICLEYTHYGYRRGSPHELRYRGGHVNHKKVLKLMRESVPALPGETPAGEDHCCWLGKATRNGTAAGERMRRY
ncbi:IS3 family transposase [Chloroflexota bacterium]